MQFMIHTERLYISSDYYLNAKHFDRFAYETAMLREKKGNAAPFCAIMM